MTSSERYKILSSERGRGLGNLIQSMTGDKLGRDLPTISGLKTSLEEIYPGEQHAALRESLFGKLKQVAEARREGADQFDLRQLGNELIVEVETQLANADRLLPAVEEEAVDPGAIADSVVADDARMTPRFRPVVGEALVNHRKLYGS